MYRYKRILYVCVVILNMFFFILFHFFFFFNDTATTEIYTLSLHDALPIFDAATRQNAFLDRGPGRMHRVIDAILPLLDLDLGGTADADHRHAAGKLCQPLLQLLTVVIGGSLLNLRLDLGNAAFDVLLFAGATDDRGVLLVDHHLLGAAQHVKLHALKLDAKILGDRSADGQDGDILQHGFAAITEAGSLNGRNLETAPQFIDDESRERLTFHILGNDEKRFAGLYYGLQERQKLIKRRQFLFID